MRISPSISLVLLASLALGCGGKSKKDDTETGTTGTVTGATSGGTASSGKASSVESGSVLFTNDELALAGSIDLIPAKEDASAAFRLQGADSDYGKAVAGIHYRVREDSLEVIEQAGGIICFLNQTNYWEQVNAGPYVALVDEASCFNEGGGESSSEGEDVSLARVTIDSSREAEAALQSNFWIETTNGQQIKGHLIVAEGPSESNPLGIFRFTWNAVGEGTGALDTHRDDESEAVILNFAESSQRGGESYQAQLGAALNIEDDQVKGGAFRTRFHGNEGGRNFGGNYTVAFDDNRIVRSGTKQEQSFQACLDRNDVTEYAWSYSLFDKTSGAAVELFSGFPVEIESEGRTYYGHAGYYGVFAPREVSEDFASVTRVEYSNGARVETPYSVVRAPGKLAKYTAASITLGELTGVEMAVYGQGSRTIAVWDGSAFQVIATATQGQGGETRTAASGTLEPSCGGPNNSCFYRGHIENLDADVFIPADEASNEYEIRFFIRSVVSGTDAVPAGNLVCFGHCLAMEPTAEAFATRAHDHRTVGPFIETASFGGQTGNTAVNIATPVATYTWNPLTHNLEMNDVAFVRPEVSSDEGQGGVHHATGALLPEAVWSALADKDTTLTYEIERLVDEFYRFETGSNPFNQFMALVDSNGVMVNFDKPINITYRHTLANDLNGDADGEYYGDTFKLSYGGPGQLWGIPMPQQEGSGEDKGPRFPVFALAPGASVGDYLAVPGEVFQVMNAVDISACAGLDPEVAPELPPRDFVTPTQIGDAPAGDLAVLYVAGEDADAE